MIFYSIFEMLVNTNFYHYNTFIDRLVNKQLSVSSKMLHKKIIHFFILFSANVIIGYAQFGFSNEIGVITGPIEFRSDFGQRQNESTNIGNAGVGFGIIHYVNFAYRADCNCYTTNTFFNDHFKLRNEISWNKTELEHFGRWVSSDVTSDSAERLRGHRGEANNFDIGMQLEFFPKSIRAFQAFDYKFAPFFSLGVHYTSFNPKASTNYVNSSGTNDVGNILDPNNFYPLWEPGSINSNSGTTWSIVSSIGIRYKLGFLSDLILDLRWQTYFDDFIDGLDHQLASNKANDWLLWLNFGYIYYID